MDWDTAIDILEIDERQRKKQCCTMQHVKKQYHKLALQYHPDKNGGCREATVKFSLVNEAYETIRREKSSGAEATYSKDDASESFDYIGLLKLFIEGFLKWEKKEFLSNIIFTIVEDYKNISIRLLDSLDKESCLELYAFLSKYKTVLGLTEDTLDKIKVLITHKYIDDQVYILNPTLDDMLDNNVYRLQIDGETFYVPLWYDEMVFDAKKKDGAEIIVKCIPDLPEGVHIDEYNQIHLTVAIRLDPSIVLVEKSTRVKITDKHEFELFYDQLTLRPIQHVTLYGRGISINHGQSIYETSMKHNIIVKVLLS